MRIVDRKAYLQFLERARLLARSESAHRSVRAGEVVPDCGCPGWGVFETGVYGEAIQRCHDCDRFPDDDHAIEHAVRICFPASGCVDPACMVCRYRQAGFSTEIEYRVDEDLEDEDRCRHGMWFSGAGACPQCGS